MSWDAVVNRINASIEQAEPVELVERAEFHLALNEAVGGNTAALVEYVRSEKPLRQVERDRLANYLAGNLKQKRGRPPPGHRPLRTPADYQSWAIDFAAHHARRTKLEWRAQGKRHRIHDAAIDAVLDWMDENGLPVPDFEAVNNALRRSAKVPRKFPLNSR